MRIKDKITPADGGGYILAKLEEIHEDVRELKEEVTLLKTDYIQRKTTSKLMLTALGALAAVVGWLIERMSVIRQLIGG